MSSAESYGGNHEKSPAQQLLEYLRGQCADALAKQRSEIDRGDTSLHGAFIRRKPGKRSANFLMKPPHPQDSSGHLARIEAVLPPSYVPADFYELDTTELTGFFVQKEIEGQAGPLWFVDEAGVHPVESDPNSVINWEPESILASDLTEQLLEELVTYNIVADSEKLQS